MGASSGVFSCPRNAAAVRTPIRCPVPIQFPWYNGDNKENGTSAKELRDRHLDWSLRSFPSGETCTGLEDVRMTSHGGLPEARVSSPSARSTQLSDIRVTVSFRHLELEVVGPWIRSMISALFRRRS